MRSGGARPHVQPGHWLAEIVVPKTARPGAARVRVAAACEVPLEVWDFSLPDRLSFVPQMNAYHLPEEQEVAYYRLAHEHRSCLNCLHYPARGGVADGAPQGRRRFVGLGRVGPPLRAAAGRSAFADLPRGRCRSSILSSAQRELADGPRAGLSRRLLDRECLSGKLLGRISRGRCEAGPARRGEGMDGTIFEFYLNNKVYFKAARARGRAAPRRGFSTRRSTLRISGRCGASAGNSWPRPGRGKPGFPLRHFPAAMAAGPVGRGLRRGGRQRGAADVSRPHPGPAGAFRPERLSLR